MGICFLLALPANKIDTKILRRRQNYWSPFFGYFCKMCTKDISYHTTHTSTNLEHFWIWHQDVHTTNRHSYGDQSSTYLRQYLHEEDRFNVTQDSRGMEEQTDKIPSTQRNQKDLISTVNTSFWFNFFKQIPFPSKSTSFWFNFF